MQYFGHATNQNGLDFQQDFQRFIGNEKEKSELTTIRGTLDHALNSYKDSIWILTDSRRSFQYLKNWPNIMDSTGLDILSKLVWLGQRQQVCIQGIPSYVGVHGNEATDELAGGKVFLYLSLLLLLIFWTAGAFPYGSCMKSKTCTALAGSDVVQSGRPIFDDFFQHLWPYIGNNTANVVFQMVKRLWLIRIDQ
ncbi:RNase H domain-containing protein [Trichonephila clavipes]|nr:RNase H domain-containing protein [Trichonephila clavipes]